MRDLNKLNPCRLDGEEQRIYGCAGDGGNGIFAFALQASPDNLLVRVLASSGHGWDHVSVSTRSRCPTWTEMDIIKRMFFEDHEVAFQLHVATDQHINLHPYTLHLWRPQNEKIPLPPEVFV
jgi:hypothetical protein